MTSFEFKLPLINKEVKKEPECKGKVFRYSENTFFSYNRKYSSQKNFTLLKRDSCKGCERCDNILSDLNEISCEQGAIIPDTLKHGDKCKLIYTNISTDWETGWVDDWDLSFEVINHDK